MAHWNFFTDEKGKSLITAFVRNDNSHSIIAEAENTRAVKQMLAYAELGEAAERLADNLSNIEWKVVSNKMTAEQGEKAKLDLVYAMRAVVRTVIENTSGRVVICPTITSLIEEDGE